MIQVYCNAPTIPSTGKYYLFPLLEPFLQPESIAEDPGKSVNPSWKHFYHITVEASVADVFILPMDIAWYLHTGQRQVVDDFIATAKQWKKPCWIFSGGDYGISWPDPFVHVLRMSGTRSCKKGNNIIMPPFIPDPFQCYDIGQFTLLDLPPRPTLGFCGHANGSQFDRIKDYSRSGLKFFRKKVGQYLYDLQPFSSPTYFRYKVLKELQRNSQIITDFQLYDQYNAGANTSEQLSQSRIKYYHNINSNAYTLCIRGAGNFSKRFYECLSCGRIPFLIDTDSIFPLENLINWKNHLFIVPSCDIAEGGQNLLQFHKSISPETWQQLLITNRKLWQEKLTYDGFFANFHLLPPNLSFAHLYR